MNKQIVGDLMEELVINERRKVVIQHAKFEDMDTIDIRIWIDTPNYKGFTRKGVNIPIEKGEELAQKILKVIKEPPAIRTDVKREE
jgi:hypothetical protein